MSTVSGEVQKAFIADRIGRVLREVFEKEPLWFKIPPSNFGWGGIMFITGDIDGAKRQISSNARLATILELLQRYKSFELNFTTPIVTDDWPYIYLKHRKIPVLYFLLAGLMVLLFIATRVFFGERRLPLQWNRSHWHFFFLGAAFLLLEVQNVSKSSVVLGNTWLVNAVIISGVLFMVLGANVIAAIFPNLSSRPAYIMLFFFCILLYYVDIARFAALPYLARSVVVGLVSTLPMLFSGIVFIRSFAQFPNKDEMLGANLIGSLVGAMLQSITFIVGFRALLLVVTATYFLAFLTRTKVVVNRHD